MELKPILWMIIPCYNEQNVLPVTCEMFLGKINDLAAKGVISDDSRILFVNDGSSDDTWSIIRELTLRDTHFKGLSLSRNYGHQNALFAGLMEAKDSCDITISLDCDGQDDIDAIDRMISSYKEGYEVVYGVRSKRDKDGFIKRTTAEAFYRLMKILGAEIVFNHADYRLISSRALDEFSKFGEVNLFLRGLVPMVGFRSTTVLYERKARIAGESHYPLRKMLSLAFDGITSLSVRPIRLVSVLGFIISFISFLGVVWAIIQAFRGQTVSGWASMTCIICFVSGCQMLCLGIIGEYVGKIYLETKKRPRFIVDERLI
ncbi:glycosyl transferase [Lachnospiraceae bacterium JC7]|nr:glycosyl transferase [Lachnospiraceae bacterium JC7]